MKDINQLDSKENILIKGARLHNLKNIDVAIPRNKFVVITGLSGSGKSSFHRTSSTLFYCRLWNTATFNNRIRYA